jgi:branched-chain amino acid transport system permease protein
VLEGSLSLVFSADFKTINTLYAATGLNILGFTFQTTRLISFVVAVVAMISLGLFLKMTFLGKAIRATVDQRRGALLVGINTERVEQAAFLIGLAMAAIGGTLLSTVVAFYPFLHFFWIGKIFAIVVLGGLGSIVGALLGGVILGVVESVTGTLAPVVWSEIVAYILLFMTLLVRPSGLLGRKTA